MGGHGHSEPYKVPHPSIYKVENIPKLREVQEALARQGLKDPWLRNEVWRYEPSKMGTHASRARAFFLRGLLWGSIAAAIHIGSEYAFSSKDDHGHGHGDGEHSEGGHH
nr:NADH dehydrogenase [ubiquinone] 1 beta subcomplex subunit 3 [Bactrocera oleae]XP_036231678.1 NADH dehydrogenase [ubiquinone] 1 beta subcomplex subunit 3 [Bactrocera oleae]XP_036231679.1 NADH dehydrogenase [ubiquinone] 1 beta subcomplex subunit 3 [Bactrocera oleae]XP_036231680.1 NADH dehydrogenase [ubiquinone] 1 beta subcomplex subunit 3 [Bactrocera oleae]XP_036231681.1 NADH dehydrogenase [ubiquinone] 1 beta subcomplex subunit 3 [Bactrocera oleae]